MAQEYVPFDAYGLLRRIVGKGPQRIRHDRVLDDAPAQYLISRKLARAHGPAGERLEETDAGRRVGLIDFDGDPERL